MATRKRGDTWYADFMVLGTRHREPFDTEVGAQVWELEARAAIKDGRPLPAVANQRSDTGAGLHTLGSLFDHVEKEHWRNNPRIKTPDQSVANARECVEFYGRNTAVTTITTDEMKRLVKHVVGTGRSYATADRKLAALSKMLRFAAEKGIIPRVPPVPLSGITNERHRFLTKAEAQKLLALWSEWDQPDLRAFTVIALHCGARLNAILSIKWRDVTPATNAILFWGGKADKGSTDRTIPLSTAARDAILDMQRRHPDEAGPFTCLKKDGRLRTMWDKMQAHLGWDDVVIHTLRHTCASWLVQKGVDLRRVQKWLGHKRIETTLIYAKLSTGDLDQCAALFDEELTAPKPKLAVINGGME